MPLAVRAPAKNTGRIIVYYVTTKNQVIDATYTTQDIPIKAVQEVYGDIEVEFEMKIASGVYSFRVLQEEE